MARFLVGAPGHRERGVLAKPVVRLRGGLAASEADWVGIATGALPA